MYSYAKVKSEVLLCRVNSVKILDKCYLFMLFRIFVSLKPFIFTHCRARFIKIIGFIAFKFK